MELEYIRLVEDYWENGRPKRRVMANFGRKDLFAPHLERLVTGWLNDQSQTYWGLRLFTRGEIEPWFQYSIFRKTASISSVTGVVQSRYRQPKSLWA